MKDLEPVNTSRYGEHHSYWVGYARPDGVFTGSVLM